jgi:hypothetical protein
MQMSEFSVSHALAQPLASWNANISCVSRMANISKIITTEDSNIS